MQRSKLELRKILTNNPRNFRSAQMTSADFSNVALSKLEHLFQITIFKALFQENIKTILKNQQYKNFQNFQKSILLIFA